MMSAAFLPPSVLRLDGNVEEAWKVWLQKFELYLMASRSDKLEERVQVAIFLSAIGDEGLHVYNTFQFSAAEDRNKLKDVIQKFHDYCTPRKNVVFERYMFWKASQAVGECIDNFVTNLRTRAKTCLFGDQEESLIRDRIVLGCSDVRLQERLLREPNLTLITAMNICRAAESTREQMKCLRGDDIAVAVNELGRHEYKKQSADGGSEFQCSRCGVRHKPRNCPAFGKECRQCGQKGHFAVMCRKKPQSSRIVEISVHENDEPCNNSSLFIGVISNSSHEAFAGHEDQGNSWWKDMWINDSKVCCKLDSGAEANVMPESVFSSLKHTTTTRRTSMVLTAFGESKVSPIGIATLTVTHKWRKYNVNFYVVRGNSCTLLGLPTCRDLQLIRRIDIVNAPTSSPTRTQPTDELIREYDDLFKGIGCMPGEHHIVTDDSVRPVIHAPRRVPLSIQPKLKQALDELVANDIIVKREEPTDWVNSLLIVEKKNGKLRLCMDPKDLNKAIKREHYIIPTIDDVLSKLHGKRLYTVIDMRDGFHHVKLDDASSRLCTFNSPYGRYSFLRLPFGINSAPEVFQKKTHELFGDIPGVFVIFDDIIIAATDEHEHDVTLAEVFKRARANQIRFNIDKFQFKVKRVLYMGHTLTPDGVLPDDSKVEAIVNMPVPTDKKGVQRLVGMVTYLAKFIPNFSALTAPLRNLLKPAVEWTWSSEHQRAFDEIKKAVASSSVLHYYDPCKTPVIQTDASSRGIGSVLMQDGHPIAFASRALTDAESRYAQIEKELMAVVYACEKFSNFIYGQTVIVQSDHKPLEAILTKPIGSTTPRLQRMLLRLLKYQLLLKYTPGKLMLVADALSRAYLPHVDVDKELQDDIEVTVHSLVREFPASNRKLQEYREETEKDETLVKLKQYLINGFPQDKSKLNTELKQYQRIASEIIETDGLLFFHGKIIVPASHRRQVLGLVHEAHLGINKSLALARTSVYWPSLARDVEMMVARCYTCNAYQRRQQPEPLHPHEVPQRPWEKVGVDIFQLAGRDYLLVVDYFSKFPEVALLQDKTASSVISNLKAIFGRHGIPDVLMADNMPFSSYRMQTFAEEWNFRIITSSPTYAQSNGQAERAIQTVKHLIKKAHDAGTDPSLALLMYRNAPLADMDVSPAQLLMSRMLRTKLPTPPDALVPCVVNGREDLIKRQQQYKNKFDKKAKSLPPLVDGDMIRVLHDGKWQKGKVVGKHSTPRSYLVTTENGSYLRRNRRHLIKTRESDSGSFDDYEVYNDEQTETDRQTTVPDVTTRHPQVPAVVPNAAEQPVLKTTRYGRTVKPPARFNDYVTS